MRWCNHKNPTEFTPQDYYPNMVLEIEDNISFSNVKFCKKEYGITNFTKAEDFLGLEKKIIETQYDLHGSGGVRSFKGQQEVYVKKSLKLNNNSMTNKTWDNLAVGWLLEYDGDEFQILSIHDRVIDISVGNNFDKVGGNFTKEELIADGFKIKGASEENKNIKEAILLLEETPIDLYGSSDRTELCKAIEMLKKLK